LLRFFLRLCPVFFCAAAAVPIYPFPPPCLPLQPTAA
jgi:hypothetical protein